MMSDVETVFRPALERFKDLRQRLAYIESGQMADLKYLIHDKRDRIDRIESRTKSFISIRDNYIEKNGLPSAQVSIGEFLENVGDLIGLRIVVFYESDVLSISEILHSSMPGASIEHKLTPNDVRKGSRFGYRASHLNYRLDCTNRIGLAEIKYVGVEIQVRTIFSDAWARHSHKLVYVNFDQPSNEMIRRFAQSAAALEALDESVEQLSRTREDDKKKVIVNPIEYELNLGDLSKFASNELNVNITEGDVRELFVSLAPIEQWVECTQDILKLHKIVERAICKCRSINFSKYGFKDPIAILKIAIYGENKEKYRSLVPLHLQKTIADVLEVGERTTR